MPSVPILYWLCLAGSGFDTSAMLSPRLPAGLLPAVMVCVSWRKGSPHLLRSPARHSGLIWRSFLFSPFETCPECGYAEDLHLLGFHGMCHAYWSLSPNWMMEEADHVSPLLLSSTPLCISFLCCFQCTLLPISQITIVGDRPHLLSCSPVHQTLVCI